MFKIRRALCQYTETARREDAIRILSFLSYMKPSLAWVLSAEEDPGQTLLKKVHIEKIL